MNDVTLELANLLVEDSIKVGKKQGYPVPFGIPELKRMNKATKFANYGEHLRIGSMKCSLHDAGHIPGSASILVENGKRIFYTGDIQTESSNLLHPCRLPKKVDILILESTYGERVRRKREDEEQRFLESVEEALAKEEIALIPVFAVGRAQEILLLLEKYANKIALDGMAKKASDIISQYGAYIKDRDKLKQILKKVHWVHTRKQRKQALKKYPIAVSSAGMLGGGPAIHYLREIKARPESKVIFAGFLVEDSPGRNLIQTKIFETAEERFHVHCELEQFELSAHADHNGLLSIIKHTNPEKVICIHGDNTKNFSSVIENEFPSIEAIAPKNGDVIGI
jgi:putative mRNA 3-end processing factor